MKTRLQISEQCYLSKSDIQKLLKIPRGKAYELYEIAKQEEIKKVGKFRPYENKVATRTVLKVADINLQFLQRQIKS